MPDEHAICLAEELNFRDHRTALDYPWSQVPTPAQVLKLLRGKREASSAAGTEPVKAERIRSDEEKDWMA